MKYACDSISRGASITTLIECECILIDIGFIGRWKKEIDILEMAKRVKPGSGHGVMNGLYLFRILLIPIQLNMCNYNNKVIEKKIFDQRW